MKADKSFTSCRRVQQQEYYLITVIAGGTGSVKLVRGIAATLEAQVADRSKKGIELTIISNVADNIWLHGLYVCPDIDTVIYGLAGILDESKGWGIQGDTFAFLQQMAMLGEPTWFMLGDRDLATHIVRTWMIREGKSLSEVTEWMAKRHGVTARVVPSTDSPLVTKISALANDSGSGKPEPVSMHLQEFWVKHKGEPQVVGIKYDGLESAKDNPAAVQAIKSSRMVIIAPGNPITSIGPIVALAEIRKALVHDRKKVIAVSPIIGSSAISGPAVKYMQALGIPNSPTGVAQYYSDFAGSFAISHEDKGVAEKIRGFGVDVLQTDILMRSRQDEIRLASFLMQHLNR
jgi:LPPG:FO 2-phospho-L-lactate transferase